MTFRLGKHVSFIGALFGLAGMLVVAGCQTTGGTQPAASAEQADAVPSTRVSRDQYSLFYDQLDHMEDLIEAGDFEAADRLYAEQKPYFADTAEKAAPTLAALAGHFERQLSGKIQTGRTALANIAVPVPSAEWPTIRSVIADAKSVVATWKSHAVVADPAFQSTGIAALEVAIGETEQRLRDTAGAAFRSFAHFDGQSFLALYPVELDPERFLTSEDGAFRDLLAKATMPQLQAFAEANGPDTLGETHWRQTGSAYFTAAQKSRGDGLKGTLRTLRDAQKLGFGPPADGVKIGFVEATSRTLLKHKQIEFPVAIDIDLPVETVKSDLKHAFESSTAKTSDYLVVIDVALANTKRRVTTTRNKPSRMIVGTKTVPNPDYKTAENELSMAQLETQTASINKMAADSQYCYGLSCLGKAVGQLAAANRFKESEKKVAEIMDRLKKTPLTIEEPVYSMYDYQIATVKGTKSMTVHYYVIDRKRRKYFKNTFDVVEKRDFDVVYNVAASDPERSDHLAAAETEDTVLEWEEAPSTVKLSQLLDDYLAKGGRQKPLPGEAALRREILKDRNTALASYKEQKFDDRPLNDPRFDSVVRVFGEGKRSFGSGFYITPDVVMTNWHVVDNAKFVEMKRFDGRETFGKVLATDVRLDVAIVKVQDRGKPVKFHARKDIDLGATVEAIGHPRGFEFSVTRGVVSAIRKAPSINLRSLVGGAGKPVLFIQTDAAINGGNSGGPLFMGNRVVGMNTWVYTEGGGSEGLNFAVHFSELRAFLRDYLPEYTSSLDRLRSMP